MGESRYVHGTHKKEQERLARLNELTNESYIQFLQVADSRRILEVGSGLGILSGNVARRFSGSTVYGLEYAAEQLAYPRTGLPNVWYLRGDAHHLPFKDQMFDLVYCRYVLEHVADAAAVVREMYRVARTGGRACVQENNALVSVFDPDCPLFDKLWRHYVSLQDAFGGDPQIGKKLYALMKNAGFHDIELSYEPEIHHTGNPTFLPWVENLIDIVRASAKDMQKNRLATREEIEIGIAEAQAFVERDDATALFYWNRAVGIR